MASFVLQVSVPSVSPSERNSSQLTTQAKEAQRHHPHHYYYYCLKTRFYISYLVESFFIVFSLVFICERESNWSCLFIIEYQHPPPPEMLGMQKLVNVHLLNKLMNMSVLREICLDLQGRKHLNRAPSGRKTSPVEENTKCQGIERTVECPFFVIYKQPGFFFFFQRLKGKWGQES